MLGKAIAYAEKNHENPVALGVLQTLLLTGYRREEAQDMQSAWVNATGGFVSFPDTKGGAQVRAIGHAALKVIQSQAEISGNPHVFPAADGSGRQEERRC